MRRLVIEIGASDFGRLSQDASIGKIESLEVLNFLKEGPDEFVTICRVKLRGPSMTIDEVFGESESEVHVFDRDDEGRYTALFKGKPRQDPLFQEFLAVGGYLSTPLEIKNKKVKVTFIGSAEEVKALLKMVRKAGISHRVVQLGRADSRRISPLDHLTDRQKRVITSAFQLGYYDTPKRINTQGLAKRLKIKGSTFAMHRIKAERRILAEILKEL